MFWLKVSLISQFIAYSASTLLPLYWAQSLGLSDTQIGYLSSVALAASLFAPIVYGALASRIRPERVILFAYLGFASCAALLYPSPLFYWQLPIYTGLCLAQNGFFTLVPVAILHQLGERAGEEYGVYRRLGSLGFLLGILFFGYASDYLGTEVFIFGIPPFVLIAAYPFVGKLKIPLSPGLDSSYIHLLRNLRFTLFLIGTVFVWTSTSFLSVFLPLRLSEMGAANSTVAWVMSMNALLAVLSLKAVGRFADRGRTLVLLPFVPIFYTLRSLLFSVPETEILWFFLIQLLHVPSWSLYDVLAIKYVKEQFGEQDFPKAQALVQISNYLGMALGAAIGALAIESFGLQQSFAVCAALPLIGFFFYCCLSFVGNTRNQNLAR